MPALFRQFVRSFSDFPVRDGDRLVVAVSGGADSVCLLHLLRQVTTRRPLSLHVAHLNHQFRPEAEAEAAFVRALAESWNLPVTVSSQPVGALSKSIGLGKQEGARHLRYLFLEETARAVGARWIATAHTADDQAETYLMRLLRGAGARGLASIPPVRDATILRPLLGIARATIEAELRRSGLKWCEDLSNRSPAYLRNRVRHELLPAMASYNPNIRKTLCQQAELLRAEDEWMTQEVLRQAGEIATVGESGIAFPIDRMGRLPRAVQRRLFRWGIDRMILERGGGSTPSPRPLTASFAQIERLIALMALPTGKRVALPCGLEAERESGFLLLRRGGDDWADAPEPVEMADATTPFHLAGWKLHLSFQPGPASDEGPPAPFCVTFDRDKLLFPLTIRGFRAGDRFAPFGMTGRKKLHDFFIDEKIPRRVRRTIPLLISQGRVAWIVGHRADATFVAGPATVRTLTIRAREEPVFTKGDL